MKRPLSSESHHPAARTVATSILMGSGRLQRGGFWAILGYLLALQLYLDHLIARLGDPTNPLVGFLAIFAAWLLLSTVSRRSHDIGMFGWFGLLMLLAGGSAGLSLMMSGHGVDGMSPRYVGGIVASFAPLLLIGIVPPSPFPNRWGAPPDSAAARLDQGSISVVQ